MAEDAPATNTISPAAARGTNGSTIRDAKALPEQSAAAPPVEQPGAEKKKGSWGKGLLLVAVIVGLIFGIPWGLNYWHYSTTHVSTDDAFVSGNLVSVSPVINGTLQDLTVEEGSYVKRGQLIARLTDATPQANLRQASANYKAALSQIPQAERNLLFQQESTDAAIRTNQWGVIMVDESTCQTSKPGVFAGGDAITGGSTVILAMGQAKKAAAAMNKFLTGELQAEPHVPTDPNFSVKSWQPSYMKAVS